MGKHIRIGYAFSAGIYGNAAEKDWAKPLCATIYSNPYRRRVSNDTSITEMPVY